MKRLGYFYALAGALAGVVLGCGSSNPAALPAPSDLLTTPLGAGIHLAWTRNSTDESEFRIERKTATTNYFMLTSVSAGTTMYHDEPVSAGETYVYRVRAAAGARISDYSNEAMITVAGMPGPVSLKSDLVPIFKSSCGTGVVGCHGRDAYGADKTQACRGWLALEDAALGATYYTGPMMGKSTGCPDRTLHQRLTELDAWNCATPNKKYITANSLDKSQVYQVVAGDPTGNGSCWKAPGVAMERMPQPPAMTLSAADTQKLASWINAGAPNN